MGHLLMTLRAPVDISAPRPQPPSHRRCLITAAVSSMLPFTLRCGKQAVARPCHAAVHACALGSPEQAHR